ncbi:MAG TPA: DUF3108 domain-containing protein [Devosia sp.]|nr:DUF3108 domain-containing protein [Devosia sp.]
MSGFLLPVSAHFLIRPFAAAAFALLTLPALAGVKAVATYGVSLGGTSIASVSISLTDSGERYSMGLNARITGLAQLVTNGSIKADSAGASTPAGLVSEKFDMRTRSGDVDYTVDLAFAKKEVTQFIVTPPIINNIDRVALERRHLHGVNDILAALVVRGGALDAGLCKRREQVFTGTERFNLTMSFARMEEATSKRTGYQGPLVLCNVAYAPVSGHYTTSEFTNYLKGQGRILIWYAPLNEAGYFIPYRALISTSAGDLSVVLDKLEQ